MQLLKLLFAQILKYCIIKFSATEELAAVRQQEKKKHTGSEGNIELAKLGQPLDEEMMQGNNDFSRHLSPPDDQTHVIIYIFVVIVYINSI